MSACVAALIVNLDAGRCAVAGISRTMSEPVSDTTRPSDRLAVVPPSTDKVYSSNLYFMAYYSAASADSVNVVGDAGRLAVPLIVNSMRAVPLATSLFVPG